MNKPSEYSFLGNSGKIMQLAFHKDTLVSYQENSHVHAYKIPIKTINSNISIQPTNKLNTGKYASNKDFFEIYSHSNFFDITQSGKLFSMSYDKKIKIFDLSSDQCNESFNYSKNKSSQKEKIRGIKVSNDEEKIVIHHSKGLKVFKKNGNDGGWSKSGRLNNCGDLVRANWIDDNFIFASSKSSPKNSYLLTLNDLQGSQVYVCLDSDPWCQAYNSIDNLIAVGYRDSQIKILHGGPG